MVFFRVSRSPGAPEVAVRTVGALAMHGERGRDADVDAQTRFEISPVRGRAAGGRLELVERRDNAVEVDAGLGGPRGTRRQQRPPRRAADRPRSAPKTTPKDVKTGFSPLTRRRRAREPLRRRQQPRIRPAWGVGRQLRRHDPLRSPRIPALRSRDRPRARPRVVAKSSAHREPRAPSDPDL